MRTRTTTPDWRWGLIAAAAMALAACGGKSGGQAKAPAQASANAADDSQLTAGQLEAKAQAAEAEANRLEAQASGQPAPDQPVGGGAGAVTRTLGPANEKLGSGEYYDTISFQPEPGRTYEVKYQAHGYTPALFVLGPDKQVFYQSKAFGSATSLDDEIKPDRAGTWYVLLSAVGVGSGGTYEVNMQEVTEQPVG